MVPRPSCPRAPTAVPEFVPPREIGAKPDGAATCAQGATRGSTTETQDPETRTFRPASSVPAVSHHKITVRRACRGRGADGDAAGATTPAASAAIAWATRSGDHVRYPRMVPASASACVTLG